MHLKSAVALALTLVSAEAVHQGFNYGAAKVDGSSKVQSDFEAEFKTAKNLVGTSGFTSARLYTMIQGGTANDPISAIPAAIAEETSLLLGLWASGGGMDNEIAALKKAIDQYGDAFTKLVVGISVGSEDLYRNSVDGVKAHAGIGINPDELVSYIEQVRSTISGTSLSDATIGHVDTWTAWVNGTNSAVIEACDWLGFDGYPYFQNTMANGIEDAKALFDEAVGKTKAAAGGKEVWITETGWPVSGKTENLAVANTENAKIYWDEVGCPLFGDVNTWWYILEDAGASPSFGVVGSDLSTTPLYDLSCKGGSSASSSSASASSSSASPVASAGASSGASTGSGSAGVAADSSSGQSAGSTEGSSGASSGQFAGSSAGSAGSGSGSEGQSTGSSTGSGSEHAAGSTGAGSTGAGSTGADSTGAGSSSGSGEQAAGSGADSTGAGSSSGSTGSSAGSSTGSGSSGSGEQAAGSGADSTGAGSSGSADQSTGSSAGSSTGSTGSSTGSSGASSGSSSGASSGSSGSSGSGSGSAAGTSRVSSAIIPGGQSTPHPGRPNIPSGGGASRVPTFASSRASSIVVPSPTKAAVSSHPTSTGSKSEGSGSGSGSGTGAGKSEGSASSSASVPLATSGATQLTGSVFSIVVLMFAVVVAV